MTACSDDITERFEEIVNKVKSTNSTEHFMELDLENFINILRSDNLNLVNEDVLVDVVKQYIQVRDKVEPKKADSAEDQTPANLWALLTDAEKENRRTAFKEAQDKISGDKNTAMEKDAEVYFSKESPDRIQHVLNIKQQEKNLEIREKAKKEKLTDE